MQAPGMASSGDQRQGGAERLLGQATEHLLLPQNSGPPGLQEATSTYSDLSCPFLLGLPLREDDPKVMLGPGEAKTYEEGMARPQGAPTGSRIWPKRHAGQGCRKEFKPRRPGAPRQRGAMSWASKSCRWQHRRFLTPRKTEQVPRPSRRGGGGDGSRGADRVARG